MILRDDRFISFKFSTKNYREGTYVLSIIRDKGNEKTMRKIDYLVYITCTSTKRVLELNASNVRNSILALETMLGNPIIG